MSNNQDTILVHTVDTTVMRGNRGGIKELEIQTLGDNINLFLTQVDLVMEKSPETVGPFKLTKFTVSAEISATGQLVILGSGGSASAKGVLTFEFERKMS